MTPRCTFCKKFVTSPESITLKGDREIMEAIFECKNCGELHWDDVENADYDYMAARYNIGQSEDYEE